jgi:putative spermidine/putrescine transport system substrate-binding protein
MTQDKSLTELTHLVRAGKLTRRDFLMRTLALGISVPTIGAALAACGDGNTGGDAGGGGQVTLSFVSWGGTFQDAQAKAWLDPYTAAFPGVTWVQDQPTDYAKIKAMVESGNVTWDVVDIGNDFALSASSEALCEKLDPAIVPFADLQPKLFPTNGYRAPCHVFSTVTGFRADKVNATPATFADFFDVSKFPGKRGCYNWVAGGLLEMALLADGVTKEQLYPLDVQRAYDKIDTIKDKIIWWDTGAQSAQLLADGEVTLGMSWNNRLVSAKEEGSDIEIMWDQHLMMADYLMIPKGSKNVEAATKFIGWVLSPDQAASLSRYIASGPANIKAVDKVDPKYAESLPTAHLDTAIAYDDQYWADNYDKLDPEWQQWVKA